MAALAWPVVVAGLGTAVVLATDRLMLGRYAADTLAAMQVAGPVVWSLLSVFGSFGAGTVAVVGRAVGRGDLPRARQTVVAVLVLALAVGVVVAAVGCAVVGPIVQAVAGQAPETAQVRGLAQQYLVLVIVAAPVALVAQAGTVALQAHGDTRNPLWISLAAGGVNLVVSYVLLYGALGAPQLGITGAAIGTVASMVIHCVGVLAVLCRGPIALAWSGGAILEPLGPVLEIATPAVAERIVLHLGYLVFVGMVGRLGPAAMAAHAVVIAIEALGFVVTAGFGVAAATLVAQRLGAGRPEEAVRCGWIAVGLAVVVLGGVSGLFLAVPRPLASLFSTDPEVVQRAVQCLQIAAVAQPLMAVSDTLSGGLRGAGDTRGPLLVTFVGQVVVRLIGCWWLAFGLGLDLVGIWIGSTVDWGVRAAVLVWIFRLGRWRGVPIRGTSGPTRSTARAPRPSGRG